MKLGSEECAVSEAVCGERKGKASRLVPKESAAVLQIDCVRNKTCAERTTNKKWEEGSTKASSDHTAHARERCVHSARLTDVLSERLCLAWSSAVVLCAQLLSSRLVKLRYESVVGASG